MSHHGVFLTHRTQPGRRDAVRTVWQNHMAPAVAGNPDHLAYYYCYDDSDPDVICVFQLYRTSEAAAAFLEHENYLAYLRESQPLLTGPPDFRAVTPMWTKATS